MSSMQCEDATAMDYYCREPLTVVNSCPSLLPSCSLLTTCDLCAKEVGCAWCRKSQECILENFTDHSSECGLVNETCPKAVPTSEFRGALAVIQDEISGFGGRLHVGGQCFDGDCNDEQSYKFQVDEFKMELKSAGMCVNSLFLMS
jgi:hypothetical protein